MTKRRPQEQRRHKRSPAGGSLKIQTSADENSYTVSARDISPDGIFIHTGRLPRAGEKITFQILDHSGAEQSTGQGQVVWVHGTGPEGELGFAIHLDQTLTPTEQQLLQGTEAKAGREEKQLNGRNQS